MSEELERELEQDLETLGERFADEEFSSELYRALANNHWFREGAAEPYVSLSWSRAEQLVNELRESQAEDALELAQSGGEGEVSDVVAEELGRLGWAWEPLDTTQEDPAHLVVEGSPPPADQGARLAPVEGDADWEETAHEEADEPEL